MSFLIYDIGLLILFVIIVGLFLYKNRDNLKKEGLLLLYRTELGIKLINYVGKKYQRTLKFLSYISIGLGYMLMISAFYLILRIVWIYISQPQIVKAIKVPPITPLIPYIDKFVPGLPNFYFIYWIIIIAIIAITHEFAHGIFMRRYNIGIKSTGFGFFPFFLPVFLAAFVEQDEKSMSRKKRFEQMAVLSAGTFANLITALLFFVLLIIFFSLAFTPVGIVFNSYAYSIVNVSEINLINNVSISNPTYDEFLELTKNINLSKIETNNKTYIATNGLLEEAQNQILFENNRIVLYDDAPAINAGLQGVITDIDGVKIGSIEILSGELSKKSPGDEIKIKTLIEDEEETYNIVLDENPNDENRPWIGIGFFDQQNSGIIGKIYGRLSSFKKPHTYYKEKTSSGIGSFVYDLLWWITLLSLTVAIINMLPMGIFDGGRFFYLTILGITGRKKFAEKSFRLMTYFFLFLFLVLMIFWVLNLL